MAGLVRTYKSGQVIQIGDGIRVWVGRTTDRGVMIRTEAPKELKIWIDKGADDGKQTSSSTGTAQGDRTGIHGANAG